MSNSKMGRLVVGIASAAFAAATVAVAGINQRVEMMNNGMQGDFFQELLCDQRRMKRLMMTTRKMTRLKRGLQELLLERWL